MAAGAVIGLLLLGVGTGLWHGQVFADYSRRFGSLSPDEFQALNDQMSRLTWVGRGVFLLLIPADCALLVLSVRRWGQPRGWAIAALILGLVVALLLCCVGMVARLPGGGMIG